MKKAHEAGKVIFVIEYLAKGQNIAVARKRMKELGFVLYVGQRDLYELAGVVPDEGLPAGAQPAKAPLRRPPRPRARKPINRRCFKAAPPRGAAFCFSHFNQRCGGSTNWLVGYSPGIQSCQGLKVDRIRGWFAAVAWRLLPRSGRREPWLWYILVDRARWPEPPALCPEMNPVAGDREHAGPSPDELHAMKTQMWSLIGEMEAHKATFAMAESEIHRLRGELERSKSRAFRRGGIARVGDGRG